MEQVRIRLEGISKSYYAKTTVTQALRKINLIFRMGEFVTITGGKWQRKIHTAEYYRRNGHL